MLLLAETGRNAVIHNHNKATLRSFILPSGIFLICAIIFDTIARKVGNLHQMQMHQHTHYIALTPAIQ